MARKAAAHGGAWKVAYADFMTALMALFMVLWITSQDRDVLMATSQYFKKPFNPVTTTAAGVLAGKESGIQSEERIREDGGNTDPELLNAIAKQLTQMLKVDDASQESPVDIEVTSDGLKVTLYDRPKQPLFEKNTANLTSWGRFALQSLAWLIERNRLHVIIDGHAAVGTTLPNKDYGVWELTADRANTARRVLERYAVSPEKIQRVSGYADTKPLPNLPPTSPSNQRLSLSLSLN